MRIRRWRLDYCTILERFQSSVKDFQVGRYFISDRRTGYPSFLSDRRTKGHDTPLYLTEGQKDIIPPPYLTEGQKNMIPPPFGRAGVGFSIIPNPSPREGSVDGWGKYGLRSSLLAFKTKWRKKGQKTKAQGSTLGICSMFSFRPVGAKAFHSQNLLPVPGAFSATLQSQGVALG